MRRSIAVVLLALTALLTLPAGAQAGGPTSVLITQPGERGTLVYYTSAEYAELERLTLGGPAVESAPADATGYRLVWLAHDQHAWRIDDLQVGADGTVAMSVRTLDENGAWAQDRPRWRSVEDPAALVALLDRAFAGQRTEVREVAAPPVTRTVRETVVETRTRWFSLDGWRWVVPGAALGLLIGLLAARRRAPDEPRQVLVDREPTTSRDALVGHRR